MNPTPNSNSLTGRLASFFREHPNCWIDGREIALIAGAYGWRSRVSDLRRAPFWLQIENRQRRERGFVVSEYCFKEETKKADATSEVIAPASLPF